jgi:hypothetical protein
MVAFSPYHVANNPFVAILMNTTYDEALARYRKVPYDKLHEYITEGLEWYRRFKLDADTDAADDKEELEDGEEGEEEGEEEVEAVSTAETEVLSCNLTRKPIGAQAPNAAAAAAPAAAAAAAATAPAAAPAAGKPAPPARAGNISRHRVRYRVQYSRHRKIQ